VIRVVIRDITASLSIPMTIDTAPTATATVHELPVLLTIDDVAAHLGVTVRHVRRLVAERRIPFIKWGHLLRFDPCQIAEWLASQRVPVTNRPPAAS
jgi:excisionase family DNA binding protein